MKILIFRLLLVFLIFLVSCDRELKEHPMPASLKRRLEMQNDPEVQRKKVSGTITIAESALEKQPNPTMLFIFARPNGQKSGPPLAVKRLQNISFPFSYSIGQMDTMLEGADFSGKVQITARLDADGVAGKGPGDLEGKRVASVGSEAVDIVLELSTPEEVVSSGGISGTLDLAQPMKGNLPKNPFLFIYARPQGAPPGTPPLVVKRLQRVTFPYEFSISEQDSMIPGAKIEGTVILTARLDADGDAKPTPGDIKGEIAVKAGENGVLLILDKLIGKAQEMEKDKKSIVSGMISVSPEIAREMKGKAQRLFIILREKGVAGAMPMAVQLHKDVHFPLSYEIGQQDAMMPGTVVIGEVEVIVRIDRDGNAKSSPGDLEGYTSATVGNTGINITLDKKIG